MEQYKYNQDDLDGHAIKALKNMIKNIKKKKILITNIERVNDFEQVCGPHGGPNGNKLTGSYSLTISAYNTEGD